MKYTGEYPCRTCFQASAILIYLTVYWPSQIFPRYVWKTSWISLKTPFWFVWRETGNKQLENFNRANTIIASQLPTCIDVVLFTVLRGNITWIIKHLGSTWEGLGWWVTLTPSELKIYQVIRHQGRNETWTIFSTCLGSFSCFVIKPITLLSFSTESEHLNFHCQLDISVIRKKRLMSMLFSQAVRSHV